MAIKLAYLGVAVLAIIAVFLGYKIYQQQTAINNLPPVTQQPQNKSTPKPLFNQATQEAIQQSTDERQVLNFPGPNATAAEIKAHSDLVNKLGNQSGVAGLDISGCKPIPIVYRVKQGSSFKVKNSDQINHTIYTDINNKTVVKANSELTLTSKSIGDNGGDFGYNCDGSTSLVGIIQIVP